MSKICVLKIASDDEIRHLVAHPGSVYELLEDGRPSAHLLDEAACRGIHWMLTGSVDGGPEPLCFLLAGGVPVGGEDVCYGPARVLTSEQVASWDSALSQVSCTEFKRRFDPKAILGADLYPQNSTRSIKGEEWTLYHLLQAYGDFQDFVAAARREQSGLVTYFHEVG